mgnify:CR=1 FL=1
MTYSRVIFLILQTCNTIRVNSSELLSSSVSIKIGFGGWSFTISCNFMSEVLKIQTKAK